MKILLVSWMLLLFGVNLNTGHYIRKLEDVDSQVYRVTEDHSGVKFMNPKPEKPTLREIMYYHVVERAFGKEAPAAITERSFTNSHGLHFLKDTDDASSESEHNDDEYKENDENEVQELENKLEDEIQIEGQEQEEETEPVTEPKPLTDKDVKEAYKHRSYLFDQLRQRYSPVKRMILPETSSRRKRDAYLEEIPDAPQLPESPPKDAYMQPQTYGMNLNSDGGYVWNNLNSPPVYYEVGQSTENPNEGQAQSESGLSQETQPPAETNVPQVTENTDSGSTEDIYVSTDRQPATPLENQGAIEEKPENESEVVEESEEPVYNPDEKVESTEASERQPATPLENQGAIEEKPENESEVVEESEEPVYNPDEKVESTEASERQPATPLENQGAIEEKPENESEVVEESEEPVYNPDETVESTESSERQPATPLENQEAIEEKPENESEVVEESEEPVYNPIEKVESTESSERQPATPLENQGAIEEKPENESEVVEESEEPVYNPDEKVESTEASERPIEPVVNDDPVPEDYNPGVEKPEFENPKKPGESDEPIEKPADSGFDTAGSSTESSEGEEAKVIPEAPTLPPLNFDNLPDYIRDAISSTEKSESHKQTDNPFTNPQLDPEDKKKLEEKMEDIFATAQPVEDIPKTYGVNLTGDSGQVWNDMVNPPVSHKVGSTDKKEEEPKAPEPTKQPNQESQEEPKPEEHPEVENPEDKGTEVPEIPKIPESENPENKEAEVPEIPELENPEPLPENPDVEDKPAELPVEPTPGDKDPSLEPGTSEGEIPKPDKVEETGDVLPEPKPEEEQKPDIMSELLKSDAFWKWLGEWTATYMELLEKHMRKIAIQEICNREKSGTDMCLLDDQPEDTGPIIKDGKIILDGKEIPVTHNSNFDELKRRYNNHKDKENNKVDATTIYGNSVGNEKVNNVFIFNVVDAKEVLEELKPGNDSKIDIIIDERGKDSKEDELKEEDKIEDKIELPKESGEIEKPIEEQKEIEDKPISSELESDKDSTEKLPLEE